MTPNYRAATGVVVFLLALAAADDEPRKVDLTERVSRHLTQIDVALDGPREGIVGLGIEDFRLFIGDKPVTLIAIDPVCPAVPSEQVRDESTSDAKIAAPLAPTSFLFFFDQHHLTQYGRENSIDLAKTMIAQLIRGGNRGAIVSSGRGLETFAGLTDRQELLIEALARLRDDRKQWDDYPALEDHREQDVVRSGYSSGEMACQQAHMYRREELARAESALDLFATVLGRFAGVDPPKIAVYFADTLRDQPGRHYVEALGSRCQGGSFDAQFAFRRVHEGAAALGVKVYAVQAEGLVPPDVTSVRLARNAAARDAQGGLKTLALETGGDAFLGGMSTENMIGRIEADGACVYLLSFDPAAFPEDKALAVRVEVERRQVRVRARTHIVIRSEAAHRMAKLLAAFAAPDNVRDAEIMQGGLVPLDIEHGNLRVLLQASIPATRLAGETWDLGVSLVAGSRVSDQVSGRIEAGRPDTRLVLEAEMELRPGPYQFALVAMENLTGSVATGRIVGDWPARDGAPRIAPIAALQPAQGVFLRDGEVRSEGSLVIAENQTVRNDLPTAFVTLVCAGGQGRAALHIERVLSGETTTNFPPIEFSSREGPCAQVRDLVRGDSLTAGPFTYSVRIAGTDVSESRVFVVE